MIGKVYRHHSGRTYEVIMLTNTTSNSDKYPVTVVYRNTVNGTLWSRSLADWDRSFLETFE